MALFLFQVLLLFYVATCMATAIRFAVFGVQGKLFWVVPFMPLYLLYLFFFLAKELPGIARSKKKFDTLSQSKRIYVYVVVLIRYWKNISYFIDGIAERLSEFPRRSTKTSLRTINPSGQYEGWLNNKLNELSYTFT